MSVLCSAWIVFIVFTHNYLRHFAYPLFFYMVLFHYVFIPLFIHSLTAVAIPSLVPAIIVVISVVVIV